MYPASNSVARLPVSRTHLRQRARGLPRHHNRRRLRAPDGPQGLLLSVPHVNRDGRVGVSRRDLRRRRGRGRFWSGGLWGLFRGWDVGHLDAEDYRVVPHKSRQWCKGEARVTGFGAGGARGGGGGRCLSRPATGLREERRVPRLLETKKTFENLGQAVYTMCRAAVGPYKLQYIFLP